MINIKTIPSKDGWISNFRIINPSMKIAGLWNVKYLFSLFGFILVKKVKQ